jgi:hypothetical protein
MMRPTAVLGVALAGMLGCSRSDPCRTPLDEVAHARTPIRSSDDANLIAFSIDQVSQVPETTEPFLRLKFRNTSLQKSLWLKRTAAIAKGESGLGDLRLDIRDAKGNVPISHCRIRAGIADPSDYLVLTPMAEFSFVISLGCFGLAPGHYAIAAYFRDRNTKPPPPPATSSWFTGTLVSNSIQFQVQAPESTAPDSGSL